LSAGKSVVSFQHHLTAMKKGKERSDPIQIELGKQAATMLSCIHITFCSLPRTEKSHCQG
jgi:hypothetical protein